MLTWDLQYILRKRLVKSPKTYWRDSGLLHTLAGLSDIEQVLGHPLCGQSWEGYCLEQIINALPKNTAWSHYRTHSGAEIDLVLENPQREVTVIEIKLTLSPKISRGFTESFNTLEATRGFYIIPQGESFPLTKTTLAMSLPAFLMHLRTSKP